MVPRLLPATALLWAVMPRFMSGIHDFLVPKTWMAGTSPAMTKEGQKSPRYNPLISPASIRRRLKRRASSPPAQL